MTNTPPSASNNGKPTFDYTVDGESQSTTEHTLTPRAIMTKAGIDPATHYLVQVVGATTKSYKDLPDEVLHMCEHMKFVTSSSGATTVSAR